MFQDYGKFIKAIPSDATAKMWGVDKGPTNVLIEIDDGRTFVVFISAARGKFFLFNGWSDVVTHLRFQTGALVILNPLDSTIFKLTYCLNGVEVAPVDCVIDGTPISDDQPAVAEQEAGRYIRFVRMAAKYFKGYRYALRRWSRFMNTAGIEVGDTVYFCFDELEQVLIVERVVPHIRHT
ncbi:hypothetical protein Hdeb2414_s0021g00576901 [Helianthus debilis subsp. tardiflorus]